MSITIAAEIRSSPEIEDAVYAFVMIEIFRDIAFAAAEHIINHEVRKGSPWRCSRTCEIVEGRGIVTGVSGCFCSDEPRRHHTSAHRRKWASRQRQLHGHHGLVRHLAGVV